MKLRLILSFLLLMFFVSAQRNREAEDSARVEKRKMFFIEKDNKFGLKDLQGKVIANPTFENIDFFGKELFIVGKNSLFGIIDKSGNVVIPIKYKAIKDSENNFYSPFDVEKNDALKKHFKDLIFAYANDDSYDEQFGIYSNSGQLMYPPVIHKFSEIKEYNGKVYLIVSEYPEIKGFTATYNGKPMKTQGTRLIEFKNNMFEEKPLPVVYSDLKFLNIKNKNILYYKRGYKGGFYNLENDKKTDQKYTDYRFSDTKIYAKKEKFYNYILDENFKETVSKDSISRVENNYQYIVDGANMRLVKDGKKAKFSYPLLKAIYHYTDSYGQYVPDEDYKKYLTNLFEFYPAYPEGLKNKAYGIINFDGKILVEPKYNYVKILPLRKVIGASYDESKKDYYKKNHLDYLLIPGGFYAPQSITYKEFKIINSAGEEIVYIDSETFSRLNKGKIFSYDENQAITKDFYIRNFSNQSGFFVYDIANKKIILESDKGTFSLRKNGGFLERFYDAKSHEQIVTYYSDKMNKLYEQKTSCKNYEECSRKIIRSKEMYISKNNKIGLIDFDENKILSAKYDSIKIFNFHSKNQYNITEEDLTTSFAVTKNGKTALLNEHYKEIIPPDYDDIQLINNPYFEAYLVKKNNKYGLISNNNIVLVPIQEDYEIIYNRDRRYFEIKNQYKYSLSQDYEQKDVWYNVRNPANKFLIKDNVVKEIK